MPGSHGHTLRPKRPLISALSGYDPGSNIYSIAIVRPRHDTGEEDKHTNSTKKSSVAIHITSKYLLSRSRYHTETGKEDITK